MNKFRLANIEEELSNLKVLEGRTPQTTEARAEGVLRISNLADTSKGSIDLKTCGSIPSSKRRMIEKLSVEPRSLSVSMWLTI